MGNGENIGRSPQKARHESRKAKRSLEAADRTLEVSNDSVERVENALHQYLERTRQGDWDDALREAVEPLSAVETEAFAISLRKMRENHVHDNIYKNETRVEQALSQFNELMKKGGVSSMHTHRLRQGDAEAWVKRNLSNNERQEFDAARRAEFEAAQMAPLGEQYRREAQNVPISTESAGPSKIEKTGPVRVEDPEKSRGRKRNGRHGERAKRRAHKEVFLRTSDTPTAPTPLTDSETPPVGDEDFTDHRRDSFKTDTLREEVMETPIATPHGDKIMPSTETNLAPPQISRRKGKGGRAVMSNKLAGALEYAHVPPVADEEDDEYARKQRARRKAQREEVVEKSQKPEVNIEPTSQEGRHLDRRFFVDEGTQDAIVDTARGPVRVKSGDKFTFKTAGGARVSGYWDGNTRQFRNVPPRPQPDTPHTADGNIGDILGRALRGEIGVNPEEGEKKEPSFDTMTEEQLIAGLEPITPTPETPQNEAREKTQEQRRQRKQRQEKREQRREEGQRENRHYLDKDYYIHPETGAAMVKTKKGWAPVYHGDTFTFRTKRGDTVKGYWDSSERKFFDKARFDKLNSEETGEKKEEERRHEVSKPAVGTPEIPPKEKKRSPFRTLESPESIQSVVAEITPIMIEKFAKASPALSSALQQDGSETLAHELQEQVSKAAATDFGQFAYVKRTVQEMKTYRDGEYTRVKNQIDSLRESYEIPKDVFEEAMHAKSHERAKALLRQSIPIRGGFLNPLAIVRRIRRRVRVNALEQRTKNRLHDTERVLEDLERRVGMALGSMVNRNDNVHRAFQRGASHIDERHAA